MIDFAKQCYDHWLLITASFHRKINNSEVFVLDTGSTSLMDLFKKKVGGRKRPELCCCPLSRYWGSCSNCSKCIGMHRAKDWQHLKKVLGMRPVDLCYLICAPSSYSVWQCFRLTDEHRYQWNHSLCYPHRLVWGRLSLSGLHYHILRHQREWLNRE